MIDEFTSSLDAVAAYTAATGIGAYMRGSGRERMHLLAAGVRPNMGGLLSVPGTDNGTLWVFDVEVAKFQTLPRLGALPPPPLPMPPPPAEGDAAAVASLFARPSVSIVVRNAGTPGEPYPPGRPYTTGTRALWELVFKPHHYLTGSLLKNARCFVARLEAAGGGQGEPVAFVAAATFPGRKPMGDKRGRRREHRLVVDPAWQGLGLGPIVSVAVAKEVSLPRDKSAAIRYISTTASKLLGDQRSKSLLWAALPTNGKLRKARARRCCGFPLAFV